MGMRKYSAALLAFALASPASCRVVSDPPKKVVAQDVEFLRGCWVMKPGLDGSDISFLRLLPEGPDGLSYQGYLQLIKGAEIKGSMFFAFTRDGSTFTMREPGRGDPITPLDDRRGIGRPYQALPEMIAAKLPKAEHRASYAMYGGSSSTPFFIAESDRRKEKLTIALVGNAGQPMGDLFRGERDGCD